MAVHQGRGFKKWSKDRSSYNSGGPDQEEFRNPKAEGSTGRKSRPGKDKKYQGKHDYTLTGDRGYRAGDVVGSASRRGRGAI